MIYTPSRRARAAIEDESCVTCRALGSGLSNLKYFSEASAAGERVLEVIRRVPKIDSASDAGEELANVAGDVEFKNVEFCYPSRPESPIFTSFSLRVPAGRTAALVGSSGSGKSTVVALLERFYDPSAGEVALDGVDIRRLRLKWLRAQMGLVSQEPALFATSIMENILFGKEDATPEEVTAAAKAANAHNFISQLPQGYDTQVTNYSNPLGSWSVLFFFYLCKSQSSSFLVLIPECETYVRWFSTASHENVVTKPSVYIFSKVKSQNQSITSKRNMIQIVSKT
jgi:ABC-type multidrug transport system fused ATPase/permease subunit